MRYRTCCPFNLQNLEDKIDQYLHDMLTRHESRIDRLETLVVCSPSADEVLDEMIRNRGRAFTQPEVELSPQRAQSSYVPYGPVGSDILELPLVVT